MYSPWFPTPAPPWTVTTSASNAPRLPPNLGTADDDYWTGLAVTYRVPNAE